jgi:hypothetical protein
MISPLHLFPVPVLNHDVAFRECSLECFHAGLALALLEAKVYFRKRCLAEKPKAQGRLNHINVGIVKLHTLGITPRPQPIPFAYPVAIISFPSKHGTDCDYR